MQDNITTFFSKLADGSCGEKGSHIKGIPDSDFILGETEIHIHFDNACKSSLLIILSVFLKGEAFEYYVSLETV
ncbi:hypothetical protein C4181_16650 [Clostridioides difficile]|nr:hypothetical protein [Clostridioides difficile]